MDNENEYEYEGKIYVQLVIEDAPCRSCALCESDGCLMAPCGNEIIFVEKHP